MEENKTVHRASGKKTGILGFTDDIAALIACTKSIISNCTADVKERAEQKVNEWFGEIKSE